MADKLQFKDVESITEGVRHPILKAAGMGIGFAAMFSCAAVVGVAAMGLIQRSKNKHIKETNHDVRSK